MSDMRDYIVTYVDGDQIIVHMTPKSAKAMEAGESVRSVMEADPEAAPEKRGRYGRRIAS